MLNLVTVCTDKYPMIYPEKLHRHFKKLAIWMSSIIALQIDPKQSSHGQHR